MTSITHLKSNDPDEVVEIIKGWQQEYIPLKIGKHLWETHLIEGDSFQIFEQFHGGATLAQGTIPSGTCGIAVLQEFSGNCLFLGHKATLNSGCLAKCNHTFEFKSGDQHKHIIFIVRIEQVLTCAEQMQRPLTENDILPSLIVPNLDAFQRFNRYLQEVVVLAKTQPDSLIDLIKGQSLKQLILADILPLFVDVLTAKPVICFPEKDSNRRHLVKQVTTLMKENIKSPITLTALCQNIGQSQRSLYYAFQETYGLAPMTYLKILRLKGILQVLKSADPKTTTVTQIATNWGFWHIGQFCADYKKMFGETPATTLNRE